MATAVQSLFERHGARDYIGEDGISQVEHALQCATLAEQAGESDWMVLACLCHDVGHLLAFDGGIKRELMGVYGVSGHEGAGAAWLRTLRFPEWAAGVVDNHVRSKRYGIWLHPEALNDLSLASQATLRYQGGAMTREEAEAFERDPLFADSRRLRGYDNAAKVPGMTTPNLGHFCARLDGMLRERLQATEMLRGNAPVAESPAADWTCRAGGAGEELWQCPTCRHSVAVCVPQRDAPEYGACVNAAIRLHTEHVCLDLVYAHQKTW